MSVLENQISHELTMSQFYTMIFTIELDVPFEIYLVYAVHYLFSDPNFLGK